jgi:DNA-binding transcriptional regulator YhcF (GntR family)
MGALMLSIDPASLVPPFEQLRLQILGQVQSGELAAGAKLSTVRRLAEDLGIAPNTVARAYRELEALGIIETRGRNGTFVSAQGDATAQAGQLAARAYADVIRSLGASADEALSWAKAALRP